MPRRTKEAAVEVDVEALIAEVAALRKEVDGLKKSGGRSSGKDSRLDKLVEALLKSPRMQRLLEGFSL